MSETKNQKDIEKAKINLETAKIPWVELQRFFAAGNVFDVSPTLDLTDVAVNLSQDNADYIQSLVASQKIHKVSDETALHWIESDALVWCVVVKPYVLVQSS